MKYRQDFITNSSSSSFIAVSKNQPDINALRNDIKSDDLVLGLRGNLIFGRFFSFSNDFFSKLNYLALIILSKKDFQIYKSKLDNIIRNDLNVNLVWSNLTLLYYHTDAYVDHQSYDIGLKVLSSTDQVIRNFLYSDLSVVLQGSDEDFNSFNSFNIYFERHQDLFHLYRDVIGVDDLIYDRNVLYVLIPSYPFTSSRQYSFSQLLNDDYVSKSENLYLRLKPYVLDDDSSLYSLIKASSDIVDNELLNDDSVTFDTYINSLMINAANLYNKIVSVEGTIYLTCSIFFTDAEEDSLCNALFKEKVFKDNGRVFCLHFD